MIEIQTGDQIIIKLDIHDENHYILAFAGESCEVDYIEFLAKAPHSKFGYADKLSEFDEDIKEQLGELSESVVGKTYQRNNKTYQVEKCILSKQKGRMYYIIESGQDVQVINDVISQGDLIVDKDCPERFLPDNFQQKYKELGAESTLYKKCVDGIYRDEDRKRWSVKKDESPHKQNNCNIF